MAPLTQGGPSRRASRGCCTVRCFSKSDFTADLFNCFMAQRNIVAEQWNKTKLLPTYWTWSKKIKENNWGLRRMKKIDGKKEPLALQKISFLRVATTYFSMCSYSPLDRAQQTERLSDNSWLGWLHICLHNYTGFTLCRDAAVSYNYVSKKPLSSGCGSRAQAFKHTHTHTDANTHKATFLSASQNSLSSAAPVASGEGVKCDFPLHWNMKMLCQANMRPFSHMRPYLWTKVFKLHIERTIVRNALKP